MLNEKYLAWGYTKNCMRELSAYGAVRKAEIGAENVFDFGLGNPNVPAPDTVRAALAELNAQDPRSAHGAAPPEGLWSLRQAAAAYENGKYGLGLEPEMICVTCGAAAGLAICANALLRPGDEAVVFAPFFTEYRVFVEGAGGVVVSVPPDAALLPDLDVFAQTLTEKTRLVIVNTPNNPSGVVLPEETLRRMADLLAAAQTRYGHPIYVVSDEPYREIVYGRDRIPNVMQSYDNSILCYSFSKSLSLPGERIGYLAVSSRMEGKEDVFAALSRAAAVLGYAGAPVMMQRAVERCLGQTADLSVYRRNRDFLYDGLTGLGFDCVKPDGAFYLFMKSPEPDAKQCSERAKKYELLLAPSDDFGVTGYLRLAYCVATDMLERSMPAFRLLAEEYGLV